MMCIFRVLVLKGFVVFVFVIFGVCYELYEFVMWFSFGELVDNMIKVSWVCFIGLEELFSRV